MKNKINTIYYPIGIDAGLGKMKIEDDYSSYVVQLIKQVLYTNPGERINRTDFGCGLRRMVFAPNSVVTANLTQITVYQALEKWLGSIINVDNVKVNANQEKLEVQIVYTLKARLEKKYLNVEVKL